MIYVEESDGSIWLSLNELLEKYDPVPLPYPGGSAPEFWHSFIQQKLDEAAVAGVIRKRTEEGS